MVHILSEVHRFLDGRLYPLYLSSDYLNQYVRSERTSFDIAEDIEDILNEVSFKDIRNILIVDFGTKIGAKAPEKDTHH